jgi:hypothetical protein
VTPNPLASPRRRVSRARFSISFPSLRRRRVNRFNLVRLLGLFTPGLRAAAAAAAAGAGARTRRLRPLGFLPLLLFLPAVAVTAGRRLLLLGRRSRRRRRLLAVALQVAFERQTLKPVFHLRGYRLWV